jgi:hypothetical protein
MDSMKNRKRYGFIAQEVKEIMPEAVYTDTDGYYKLDYDPSTSTIWRPRANLSAL